MHRLHVSVGVCDLSGYCRRIPFGKGRGHNLLPTSICEEVKIMTTLAILVEETVATLTAEELEALVTGTDDVDHLGASMCSCDAGDDNPR